MSVVAAYVGRTVDLLALRGVYPPPPGVDVLQNQYIANGDGGLLCTGLEKLCQRVVYVLLNQQGTLLYAPTVGTTLITQASQGYWRTVADVQLAFTSARLDLVRQIQAVELDSDPLDEQLSDVELVNVTLAPDSVSLQLAVTSMAGTSRAIVAPIPFPIN